MTNIYKVTWRKQITIKMHRFFYTFLKYLQTIMLDFLHARGCEHWKTCLKLGKWLKTAWIKVLVVKFQQVWTGVGKNNTNRNGSSLNNTYYTEKVIQNIHFLEARFIFAEYESMVCAWGRFLHFFKVYWRMFLLFLLPSESSSQLFVSYVKNFVRANVKLSSFQAKTGGKGMHI